MVLDDQHGGEGVCGRSSPVLMPGAAVARPRSVVPVEGMLALVLLLALHLQLAVPLVDLL